MGFSLTEGFLERKREKRKLYNACGIEDTSPRHFFGFCRRQGRTIKQWFLLRSVGSYHDA